MILSIKNLNLLILNFGDDNPQDQSKKPWTDSYDSVDGSHISFMPKHPGLHENPTIDDQVNIWHPSRKSRLLVLEQNKLQIQHPRRGRSLVFIREESKC